MPSNRVIEKKKNGFHIGKTPDQLEKEKIVGKTSPTNKEIVFLLTKILEKLEGE